VGEKTFLKSVITSLPTLGDKQNAFSIEFEWDNDMGTPGAFYIENYLQGGEFFLVSLTLEDVPNHGTINFVCNSWVYNAKNYKTKRIFFANKVRIYINYIQQVYNLKNIILEYKFFFSKNLIPSMTTIL